jgi:hypothetical protein
MGEVHQLPTQNSDDMVPAMPAGAKVLSIDGVRCGLCGAELSARSLRYHVVSPQASDVTLTVCHTCRKAALGEGYRPAK